MSHFRNISALFLVLLMSCIGLIPPSLSIKRLSKTQSFSLPESSVHDNLKIKTTFASLLFATSLIFGTPTVATAVGGTSSVFTNDYNDPLHPLCERHVKVSSDGKAFHFSGTQGKPGCTPGDNTTKSQEHKNYDQKSNRKSE
jgi:hypothetical protein